jgi:hypothetical protein
VRLRPGMPGAHFAVLLVLMPFRPSGAGHVFDTVNDQTAVEVGRTALDDVLLFEEQCRTAAAFPAAADDAVCRSCCRLRAAVRRATIRRLCCIRPPPTR